jgi:hypothetical protein
MARRFSIDRLLNMIDKIQGEEYYAFIRPFKQSILQNYSDCFGESLYQAYRARSIIDHRNLSVLDKQI